jgi:hypothetical protein
VKRFSEIARGVHYHPVPGQGRHLVSNLREVSLDLLGLQLPNGRELVERLDLQRAPGTLVADQATDHERNGADRGEGER